MSTQLLEVPYESRVVRRRAFVVVGMHRSGTSAMARTLSLLGAALPKHLMPAVASNESGFWEPQAIVDLNDEILTVLDSEWDDVFASRSRPYLSNFDRFYLGRAVELIEENFNGSEVIVLKDPRISVLTAFWDRALLEAGFDVHYVVMVRNPLEVADSLRARDGFPREKSFLLWSSYMIAIDRDTRSRSRTFVSYDQLMSDWRGVRRRIEAGAKVPFPRDTAAAAIEIDRFLDPGMHHHVAESKDLYTSDDVPEQVKSLYRIFSEACEGGDLDIRALKAVQEELEKLESLVGPLLADMRGSTRGLSNKVAELAAANVSVTERANALEETLKAERALRESEAAAASASNAVHETRCAELAERLAATEGERDRLRIKADEKARSATEFAERLVAVKAEMQHEIDVIRRDAEEARNNANAAVKLNEDNLARRFEEVATLSNLLRQNEEEIRCAKRDAEEARKTSESERAQRFQEVSTLTRLIRQEEQRAGQADEQIRWLLAIHEQLRKQPRKWSFLPPRLRRRRLLRRLQKAGLFDADAYLRFYTDVAEAGFDPLDHYLEHGIHERRLRNP